MKLVEWNIHKMTNDILVKPFVIKTLKDVDADIVCLVEYLTDTGIEESFLENYWFEESNTISGNKVFIAVKKEFAPGGITVINKNEKKGCYNFLHVAFSMKNGNHLSVIGIRMLSPIDASKQTPPLKDYLSKLKTPFLCTGDFNIKDFRMSAWFPNISIQNMVRNHSHLSDSSIIYANKDSCEVTGFGAVDHVLHSDNIEVNSEYDWKFLSCDSMYPSADKITIGALWNVPPAYPDHALMVSNFKIHY